MMQIINMMGTSKTPQHYKQSKRENTKRNKGQHNLERGAPHLKFLALSASLKE